MIKVFIHRRARVSPEKTTLIESIDPQTQSNYPYGKYHRDHRSPQSRHRTQHQNHSDSTIPADNRTPLDALIEKEEEEDDDRTFDAAGLKGINPDMLIVLLHFITPGGNPLLPGYFKTVATRVAALCSALHVHPIGNHSLQDLAGAIGATRSLLSLYKVELRDMASLDHRGGRSVEARLNYAVSARQAWGKRGRIAKASKKHEDEP